MPGFDGTGPLGEGPLTGRGMGICGRGFGFRRFRSGRGLRFGPFGARRFGGFFGRGRGYSREDLQEYRKLLEEELEALKEYESELQSEE